MEYNLADLFESVADTVPDREALVYADRGLRYTYREFDGVAEECARALMALGLGKGDHVAVWGQNVPEWVILQFATGKMGAVLVTTAFTPQFRLTLAFGLPWVLLLAIIYMVRHKK